jgi:hypothetical protein
MGSCAASCAASRAAEKVLYGCKRQFRVTSARRAADCPADCAALRPRSEHPKGAVHGSTQSTARTARSLPGVELSTMNYALPAASERPAGQVKAPSPAAGAQKEKGLALLPRTFWGVAPRAQSSGTRWGQLGGQLPEQLRRRRKANSAAGQLGCFRINHAASGEATLRSCLPAR